jgi:hypothetical protein
MRADVDGSGTITAEPEAVIKSVWTSGSAENAVLSLVLSLPSSPPMSLLKLLSLVEVATKNLKGGPAPTSPVLRVLLLSSIIVAKELKSTQNDK